MKHQRLRALTVTAIVVLLTGQYSHAENWSVTEAQLQNGDLKQTGTNGGDRDTTILTLQHAGGWKYGDNFFFADFLSFDKGDAGTSNGSELYSEWYSNFSLGKITGREIKFGPIKDLGVIAGFNYAPEVDSWWFLPGVRFELDLPGFAFANLDITSYINQSNADDNATGFVIKDEGSSYMVDFNWAYPFKIGSTSWSLKGHAEYIDGRSQVNTFGEVELKSHILAQPQLRFDLGETLFNTPEKLYIGIEYQYWKNKLGEDGLKDNTAQFLAVWRM